MSITGQVHYLLDEPLPQFEAVINPLVVSARHYLQLPHTIVIAAAKMDGSIWGGTRVDPRWANRITINVELLPADLPIVIVHELIHVEQLHTGILRGDVHGNIWWRGSLYRVDHEVSWEEYCRLPWEVDVSTRIRKLLHKIVDHTLNTKNK